MKTSNSMINRIHKMTNLMFSSQLMKMNKIGWEDKISIYKLKLNNNHLVYKSKLKIGSSRRSYLYFYYIFIL